MGINLSDIVVLEPRKLEDFSGKVLAIDAFNTLYQFLAIIRQPDGTPLMDHEGRVTSHLSGIIYRVSNFVAASIKPAFVFDGEPPRLKARTLVARGEIKRRAEREWREAVEIGDLATARTKAMQTSRLTDEMVDQSKRGVQAPGLHLGVVASLRKRYALDDPAAVEVCDACAGRGVIGVDMLFLAPVSHACEDCDDRGIGDVRPDE